MAWKTLGFSTLYSLCLWGVGWWGARQVLFSLLSPTTAFWRNEEGISKWSFILWGDYVIKATPCAALGWADFRERGPKNAKYFLLREMIPKFSLVYTYQHCLKRLGCISLQHLLEGKKKITFPAGEALSLEGSKPARLSLQWSKLVTNF